VGSIALSSDRPHSPAMETGVKRAPGLAVLQIDLGLPAGSRRFTELFAMKPRMDGAPRVVVVMGGTPARPHSTSSMLSELNFPSGVVMNVKFPDLTASMTSA
jgi:hypothetical protein